ncbi:acyltransferase family protein [Mycobacterium stomatepiae]|uniref:acyltransferase family protein n=1 Tax=Mycobacterium stomatepiae TaxID=470076 RepID=UPI0013D6A7D9|nr:acyltransferase [Mycobacterium stomatepiae]MCV7165534.1 acyltransferase [Mycobacterium stomatepiae]
MKLAQVFDPRNSALNLFRLLLAAEVMLFHSWPVTGRTPPHVLLQLLFSVGVDGFFAISGFLITASWLNDPKVRNFLSARALRILPGLYVCLIVTAFVFAPLNMAITGGSATKLLTSFAPIEFVLKNSGVAYIQHFVGATPRGVPFPEGGWNASLWSLIWELMCYLTVAGLGLAGLGNRRWISPVLLEVAAIGATLVPPLTFPGVWTVWQLVVRTAIMFASGAVLYQWRDVVPARWWLVAVSAVIVVVSAALLPDYRVVAALPLAYAVIVSAAKIHIKYLRLRTDLSYGVYIYAFPTQQLLASCGFATLNPIVFAGLSTTAVVPMAALSWLLVEKPARSFKFQLKRKWSGSELVEAGRT